ncbi:MAG: MarR family transcriptional regulator [Steroidobacteraceae bacterium]
MPRPTGVARRRPQAAQREALEHSALLLARALVDRMRSLYRELERHTGAPVQMHRALACVAASPGIAASGLANELGMQRSALSHLLRSLVERGWVQRQRDVLDQRSVRLFVTASGHEVVQATAGRVAGILQRAVNQLDDRDLVRLERSLSALLRHVEPPLPAGTPVAD